MSRPRDSVNRTRRHLYIKRRPDDGSGTNKKQPVETGKQTAPCSSTPKQYQTKLDIGFYLHRRGRTSINTLCLMCALNPFKLTRAMVPQLSPLNRTSTVLIPRQLAPTVGPPHDGFEFLKGSFEGIKGYAVGRMTKSHRGRIYIDDAGWEPEADSIEYGYRVPFGGIHVFIGKIGEPGSEPDIFSNIVEPAQRARSARIQPAMKRAFVGAIHGVQAEDRSDSGGETVVYSDDESSSGETESLYLLRDDRSGGISDGDSIPDPFDPPNRVAVFMAGSQSTPQPTVTGAFTAGAGGSGQDPSFSDALS